MAKDSTSSDLKIKLEGRVGSLYTVYMSHKEHYRTIEKRKALLGQCWKTGEHSGSYRYIVQASHIKSVELNQRRSEKVREGRAHGTSQARFGRGGVKVREDCTLGEALCLTVTTSLMRLRFEGCVSSRKPLPSMCLPLFSCTLASILHAGFSRF